jgi:hypothetical protein
VIGRRRQLWLAVWRAALLVLAVLYVHRLSTWFPGSSTAS